MDGNKFDDLSRKLATGLSRRAALRGAVGGLLGALGLRSGAGAQVSQAYCGNTSCRTNPGKCKEGCVCCVWPNKNSRCMPPDRCEEQIVCAPGKVADPILGCIDPCTGPGNCTPPPANSCKVATCNVATGLCGFGPAPNNTACGAGKTCCGGSCVSNTTVTNCLTCGTTCSGSTPVCNATTGCVQCNTAANCPPPNTSICQGAATCNAGVCEYGTAANNASCGAGKVCCGGICTVNTTVTNCGTCGNACTTNQVCTAGTCTCPNATCGAACCAVGQVCIAGACASRGGPGDVCDLGQDGDCQDGLTCCSGICHNLNTSLNNCGECGNICQTAEAGTCEGDPICTTGDCGFTALSSGTECRASTSACDPAEVCNGTLLTCPENVTTPNGQPGTCPGTNEVCCDETCTELGTSTDCLTCGNACAANEVCDPVNGCDCPNAT